MSIPDTADQNIQMWKVKRLIRSLDAARGSAMRPYCFNLQSSDGHLERELL